MFPATDTSRSRNATGCPETTALTVMDIGKTEETSGFNPGMVENDDDEVLSVVVRHFTVWHLMAVLSEDTAPAAHTAIETAATATTTAVTTTHLRIQTTSWVRAGNDGYLCASSFSRLASSMTFWARCEGTSS